MGKKVSSIIILIIMLFPIFQPVCIAVEELQVVANSSTTIIARGKFGETNWQLNEEGTLTIGGTGSTGYVAYPTSIPWYSYRQSITKVIVKEGVTGLTGGLVEGCDNVEKIIIPSSVKELYRIFGNMDTEQTWGLSNTKIVSAGPIGSGANYEFGWTDVIPRQAFGGLLYLEEIELPEGITKVSREAFRSCRALKSIKLPESLEVIEDDAFKDCIELVNIDLPKNLKSIGNNVFKDCTKLENITISKNVNSIGQNIFEGCTSIKNVSIDEENQYYRIIDGILYTKDLTTLIKDWNINTMEIYTIPTGVKYINEYAFCNESNKKKLIIPDTVEKIGQYAFSESTITEIEFSKNIKIIEEKAFYDAKVKNIELEGNIEKVGKNAFDSIRIKNIVMHITPDTIFEESVFDWYWLEKLTFIGAAPIALSGCKWYNENVLEHYGVIIIKNQIDGEEAWIYQHGVYGDIEELVVERKPKKTVYKVGEELNLEGILVKAIYTNKYEKYIENQNITVDDYDFSTNGRKKITIHYKNGTSSFDVGVHEEEECIEENTSKYPETSHNYEDNLNETYIYTYESNNNDDEIMELEVLFSENSYLEENYDKARIYDKNDNLIKTYTGSKMANNVLTIPGDTIKINFTSDEGSNYYGFSINYIKAKIKRHDYDEGRDIFDNCVEDGKRIYTCKICDGEKQISIPAENPEKGHEWASEYTVDKEATDFETGIKSIHCIKCNAIKENSEQIILAKTEQPTSIRTIDGTDYYEIQNEKQLIFISLKGGQWLEKNYILTEDIILNNIEIEYNKETGELLTDSTLLKRWNPIGTESRPFTGIFDGNNHTISGIYVDNILENARNQGLFGYIEDNIIRNLNIENSYIRALENVGGIIGSANTKNRYIHNINIENCSFSGAVVGRNTLGGIVGTGNYPIKKCTNKGNIYGNINIEDSDNNLSGCKIGGVAGDIVLGNISSVEIVSSQNTGKVTGAKAYIGGIVGYGTDVKIIDSYNLGEILGSNHVGGLNGSGADISNSYNSGDVSGKGCIGGLIGTSENKITNSYNMGNVTGEYQVGGIAGYCNEVRDEYGKMYTTIDKCYNIGIIEGTEDIGGIVGYYQELQYQNHQNIYYCYYIKDDTINQNIYGIGRKDYDFYHTQSKPKEFFPIYLDDKADSSYENLGYPVCSIILNPNGVNDTEIGKYKELRTYKETGTILDSLPELVTRNKIFKGWADENGNEIARGTVFLKDTVIYAQWIDKEKASYIEVPIAKELIENGEEQELIFAGSTEHGKIQYSLDGESYSENIPTAKNKGIYKIYYKIIANEEYLDSEVSLLQVTIKEKKTESQEPEKEYKIGDVTGDGKINTLDAVKILQFVSKKTKLTDTQSLSADTNKDGKVNTLDAVKILQYVAKKITKL